MPEDPCTCLARNNTGRLLRLYSDRGVVSSAGSAPGLQPGGRTSDSCTLHLSTLAQQPDFTTFVRLQSRSC